MMTFPVPFLSIVSVAKHQCLNWLPAYLTKVFWMMKFRVISSPLNKLKVFYSIVRNNTISVMNHLLGMWFKYSSKASLHNKPMFRNVTRFGCVLVFGAINQNIPLRTDTSSAFPHGGIGAMGDTANSTVLYPALPTPSWIRSAVAVLNNSFSTIEAFGKLSFVVHA